MRWLVNMGRTVVAAFEDRWLKVPKWVSLLVGTPVLGWIAGYLEKVDWNPFDIPIWPTWLRMVFAFLVISLVILLDYATKIRIATTPLVKIGLAPVENSILKHPVEAGGTMESMKRVVNGKVTGIGQGVHNCEANIVAIRYQRAEGEPFVEQPEFASFTLPWTRHNGPWDQVPRGITKYFRIVQVKQDDNRLFVPGAQEIALFRRLFVNPGKYEIDIVVSAGVISQDMTVVITYSGDWEDLAAVEKPSPTHQSRNLR